MEFLYYLVVLRENSESNSLSDDKIFILDWIGNIISEMFLDKFFKI